MKFTSLLLTSPLSSSPEMLSWLKVPFRPVRGKQTVAFSGASVSPATQAALLALSQTQTVRETRIGEWVLGTYTLVESHCKAQPAPGDNCDARTMLRDLSGQCYQVHTGLALRDPATGRESTSYVSTRVWLQPYTDVELDIALAQLHAVGATETYVDQSLMAHVEGCYANVLGFPLCAVANMLEAWGLAVDLNIHGMCRNYLGFFCKDYSLRTRAFV